MEGYGSRRAKERKARTIKLIAAAVLLCLISYKLGYDSVRSRESAYKDQLDTVQKDRGELEAMITSLRAKLQLYKIRYAEIKRQYEQDVPTGELKQITDLVKRQLNAGIKPRRLYQVITSANPPKNCSSPESKRFVMPTPAYKGPASTITFANGAISISGKGQSAINTQGKIEAWYDSGKDVEILFENTKNGKKVTKKGLLPIYNTMVIGSREYRFTVAAGERSFINVTGDSCDYP